ncbi:MAG: 4Fe-4S binding protein [Candidatus Wallbacteria bacterium]|nr:4Fe-4S binding protein [Candidatus Wallbacteria bacterium]
MFKEDGVLKESEIILPPEEILKKGKTVVIECVEHIPCNPCETSCPKSAITVGSNICDLPSINYEKCSGCTLCVAICPGLAVFVVDKYSTDDESDLILPYELSSVPAEGEIVVTLDRAGEIVGRGRVIKIAEFKIMHKRKIITLRIPRTDLNRVRHFRATGKGEK